MDLFLSLAGLVVIAGCVGALIGIPLFVVGHNKGNEKLYNFGMRLCVVSTSAACIAAVAMLVSVLIWMAVRASGG